MLIIYLCYDIYSMLTQYSELRTARGRTLALEHDTTLEDIRTTSNFGVTSGMLYLHLCIV
jgi:hypothetical protein